MNLIKILVVLSTLGIAPILADANVDMLLALMQNDVEYQYDTTHKASKPVIKETALQREYMDILRDIESDHLHWNAKEKTFTTPYGVYALHHNNSKVVKLLKSLAVGYGFKRITRSNYREIDSYLNETDIAKIRKLAWEEVYLPMTQTKVYKRIVRKDTRKVFFSLVVNTGQGGANKSIRKSGYNASPHGLCKAAWYGHYAKLSNKRYGIFKKGWLITLKELGFKVPRTLKRRYKI